MDITQIMESTWIQQEDKLKEHFFYVSSKFKGEQIIIR